jgi:hypothetical protein
MEWETIQEWIAECWSTGAMGDPLVPQSLSRRLVRHSFGNQGRRRKLGERGSHPNYLGNRVPSLKSLHDGLPLPPMTVNDRVDRRRPVTGRYIVPQERKLKTAAAEKPPRLKRRGKSETTP